jgi:fluoroquinolone transport system permease protein
MLQLKALRALGALDAHTILADPLLRSMALVPLLVALAVRLLLPPVLTRVSALAGLNLGWIEAPLAGYAVVGIAPLLAGTVVGFLLLDQRDDRTLLALRVTPLPLGAYLAYRLALPSLTAVPLTVVALAVANVDGLGPGAALLAALAAAPLAPLTTLALLALARNKLEGMALMKLASLILAAPLVGLFLPPPWPALLALVPTSWVAWTTWAVQAGDNPWPSMVGAWVAPVLLVGLLGWRLRRVLAGG